MLINLSNHPSGQWGEYQIETAKQLYGSIVDIPFPIVDPNGDEEYICSMAKDYCRRILDISSEKIVTVHVMGEMTLTMSIVSMLKKNGVTCIASTTERCSKTQHNGKTISVFRFVRFRRY